MDEVVEVVKTDCLVGEYFQTRYIMATQHHEQFWVKTLTVVFRFPFFFLKKAL